MKAVVMAGGEGTRLRPLTSNQPKPMVHLVNKPVIEHIFELLKKHDFTDTVVTLQFLPQLIKNYFGDGSDMGLNISYSIEDSPLGTAGSVKKAEAHLNETFIVISGDALTDIDLTEVIKFHKKKKAIATIALKQVENPLEFGIVITDKKGRIERFLEKPSWGEVFSDTINTGIYVLEPEVFDYIPENTKFDFSKELFPMLLKDGKPLYGCVVSGYWCDIGNLNQYREAHTDVLDRQVKTKISGIKMLKDIWIEEGANVHPSAELKGPLAIGQNARIEENAKIGKYSVIGDNVIVGKGARLRRAIVGDNSYVGERADLVGSVVGRNCDVKKSARVLEKVVIGDECIIGENAVINHDVKIYPFKTIDPSATINQSLIWESRGVHTLFGKKGVSGLINIDITPSLATLMAMAYGTTLPKGSQVAVSRDYGSACRMIKGAILAGLNASGVYCQDLRTAPAPVNRFCVQSTRCVGGVHVKIAPFDSQTIEINFFDSDGTDVDEGTQRKIERYFYREDLRRVFYSEVGDVSFPARTTEFYTDGLLKNINKNAIREKKFKLIIDYSYGGASLILPYILGKLGCNVVSLNAFTGEKKPLSTEENLKQSIKELASNIKLFKADFGVFIDSGSEKVFYVDEKGKYIEPETALFLMIDLFAKHEKRKGKIAVPLSVSDIAEQIAEENGRRIVRSKVSKQAIMDAATKRDVSFAGTEGGGYVFPHFLAAYDAVMTLCKFLEYMAKADKPLSKLVGELPKCYLAQDNTYCPWDYKGLVMRRLVERAKGKKLELLDGVKVIDSDRWALVLPDPEEPVFRVFAEADSKARAQAEVKNYVSFINNIVKG